METISITQIKINMIEEITQVLSEKIEPVGEQVQDSLIDSLHHQACPELIQKLDLSNLIRELVLAEPLFSGLFGFYAYLQIHYQLFHQRCQL